MNAFHDFEYIEPDEEEVKHSQQIADEYLEEQSKEEQEWFIKQEEELLKQLIRDCQVEEFIGDGELDEETIKAIYEAAGIDNEIDQETTGSTLSENSGFKEENKEPNQKQEIVGPTIIKRAKGKNKKNNRRKNNKNKQQSPQTSSPAKSDPTSQPQHQNDMFYENSMYETCKTFPITTFRR